MYVGLILEPTELDKRMTESGSRPIGVAPISLCDKRSFPLGRLKVLFKVFGTFGGPFGGLFGIFGGAFGTPLASMGILWGVFWHLLGTL